MPWNKVDLSATLTVEQVGGLVQFDMAVVRQPSDVDSLGHTAALPSSAPFLHEWEPFWVELWVDTPEEAGIGVAGGTLDLAYDTRRFTATRIENGAAFTHQTTGTIDDASGLIRNLGGLTTRGGVGFVDFQDLTVLLAAWTGPGGAASPQAAVAAAIVPRETGTAALHVNRRSAVSKRRRSIERWLIDLSRAVFSRDKLAFSAKGQ